MKKLPFLHLLFVSILLSSCSHSVTLNTKEEAVKFLESHSWVGKNVTFRIHGKEITTVSMDGDIVFSNNKVIYDREWSNYTIALDKEGDKDWYFTITFNNSKMSPFMYGIEMFRLNKDGTAHCYPSGNDDGVFADYDFPESRTPDRVTNSAVDNNSALRTNVVNINDGNACIKYLKGKSFSTVLYKISFTNDLKVSMFKLPNNNLVFTGSVQLGHTIENYIILEVHSLNNNNDNTRYFLYSDGTLETSSSSGMKYKPQLNEKQIPDSVTKVADSTATDGDDASSGAVPDSITTNKK